MKAFIFIISTSIKVLSIFSLSRAVNWAFKLFQKPQTKIFRPHEERFYAENDSYTLPSSEGLVHYFDLGPKDGQLVVLVHGWMSNAASMSDIANVLVEKGYRAVMFDSPAHGQSKVKLANLHSIYIHMKVVLDHINPSQPIHVIGHSFGSLISAYTLSKLNYKVEQLIYLTTPMDMESIFLEYKSIVGLSQKVYDGIQAKGEELIGEPLTNVTSLLKTGMIDYEELTFIHDRNDKMLSFSNSETLSKALSNSKLIPFENIGHYRMLSNTEVIDITVNQLIGIKKKDLVEA